MERRAFLALTGALAAGRTVSAADGHTVAYSETAYAAAMARGAPLLLDFYAPW